MRNQNSFFVIFALSLTVGLLGVYSVFVGHFNGQQAYEYRISALQKQVEKERFQQELLSYQLKDFQQTVAQVLPDNKTLQANYELNKLATAVRAPASAAALDLSGAMFARGKKFFQNKDFDKAIKEFNSLVVQYPLSPYRVEAQFFVAESYFLKKDFHSSLVGIEHMVLQYPEHELTGFILLRMGQISELSNQAEEAAEIYQTVLKNFQNEDLKKQAKKLAQGVEYR